MITLKFIKSSLTYSVIGALPLATSVILLPFYTNLLSTDDFGMLMIYIIFAQLVQILFSFGLENYIAISYIENKNSVPALKKQIGTATSSLLILGVLITLFFIAVGDPLFQFLNHWLYTKDTLIFWPWGFLSVLTGFCMSYFKAYTALLIYQERPGMFFWANILHSGLIMLFSIVGINMFPFTLLGPVWGRFLGGLVAFLFCFVLFQKDYGHRFYKELIRPMFRFSFPILQYLLIFWVVTNIDRYIILSFETKTAVGIFDFAVKCTFLIEFFQNGLLSAIQPKIFNLWNENNERKSSTDVNRYYNGFIAVTLFVLPLFLIAIPLIVPWFVSNKAYYLSFDFLALLTIGYATRGLYYMYYNPLLFFKNTKALPRVYFYSALFQVVMNIALIKYYGIMGAVWVNLMVKFVQIFFLQRASRRIFEFAYNKFKQFYLPGAYILMVLLSYFFVPQQWTLYAYLIQFVVISALIWMVYRREVKMLVEKLFLKDKPL